MRKELSKLKKGNSTKAERRFAEILKKNHIPFKTKIKINNREIDFLIGSYAIDIDGHDQASGKNEMLAKSGFIPIHISNKEIERNEFNKISKWCIQFWESSIGRIRSR